MILQKAQLYCSADLKHLSNIDLACKHEQEHMWD